VPVDLFPEPIIQYSTWRMAGTSLGPLIAQFSFGRSEFLTLTSCFGQQASQPKMSNNIET
jgi:hypothetical protein